MNHNKLFDKLLPGSHAWMVSCLDPFHDDQMQIEGFPDLRSAPSVVQMHNQAYTLSAPASAAGGNWDARVCYTGFDCQNTRIAGLVNHIINEVHPYDSGSLSVGAPFGAFTVKAVASNAQILEGAPVVVGEVHEAFGSVFSNDKARLIAVAFEIQNTTADIYKQGSLTVGMMPDCTSDNASILYIDSNVAPKENLTVQSDRACLFPSSTAQLQSVPSSQTWEAREGVYAIPRIVKPMPDGGPAYFANRTPMVIQQGAAPVSGTINSIEPLGVITDGTYTVPSIKGYTPSAFSPICAYLSGLSPETTLVIKMRTIVEYFPAVGSNLLPLATPSPAYDPRALSIYSSVVQTSPYAVQVNQNSAGDYFRTVMRIMSQVGPVLAPFTGPFSPAVSAASALAKVLAQKRVRKVPDRRVSKTSAGARAMPTRR